MERKSAGFTLIEISVVLVIIGLIIGGILVGTSLIRSSELNSIISDIEKIKTAVHTFRTKYNQLPGDMANATEIWGRLADCRVAESGTATCNGNNDGFIRYNSSASATSGHEVFQIWKQLANAELLSGSYTGINDGANYYSVTSRNSPSGKIQGSLYHLFYVATLSDGNGWGFSGKYGNLMEFGIYRSDNRPYGRIVSPSEAQAMDSKNDDGRPSLGTMRVRVDSTLCTVQQPGSSTPATDADTATATYVITSNAEKRCVLLFPNIF